MTCPSPGSPHLNRVTSYGRHCCNARLVQVEVWWPCQGLLGLRVVLLCLSYCPTQRRVPSECGDVVESLALLTPSLAGSSAVWHQPRGLGSACSQFFGY